MWLSFEVETEGSVCTIVTRQGEEGLERESFDFPSLAAAAERFGPGFRQVVEEVLASGSRKGRWRP